MRSFKGSCEIGFKKEDLKQIVEEFLNGSLRLGIDNYVVEDLKLSPNNKYCIRVTFKTKEKRV